MRSGVDHTVLLANHTTPALSAGAITVHSIVAPPGELRGKGGCGVFSGKTV